jgi:hypothetical protein
MRDYKITIVPIPLIEVLWRRFIPHLEKAIELSHGDATEESIKNRALSGNSLIVIVTSGADIYAVTTVEVVSYDSGLKSLLIPMMGGTEVYDWGPPYLEFAKQIARNLGCRELRGISARDGWMRVLKSHGWIENHAVITCSLDLDEVKT